MSVILRTCPRNPGASADDFSVGTLSLRILCFALQARSRSGSLPLRSFSLRDSVTTMQDRAPTTAILASQAVRWVRHPHHLDRGPSSKVGRIRRRVVGRRHRIRDRFHIHRRKAGQEVFNPVLDTQAYGVVGDVYLTNLSGPSS